MSYANEKEGTKSRSERDADIQPLPAEDIVNVGGEQGDGSDTTADHSERPMERRDHSEREGGGDQDIDTAGQVPGNKAPDDSEPKGA